jgi:hypothetical protein
MVEFEHTLFMLLLLVGIFSAKPPQQKLALVFIVGGTLLALLPPFVRISISWEWILNLTLPLLFWQNARHWLHARWRIGSAELALWLLSIAGLTVSLGIAGYLTWAAALLFGIVAASMLWRAIESEQSFSHLSQLGPLTLIFLLTEIAPAVETPGRYLGGLFSGAAVGIAVAFISIYLSRRLLPQARGWVALGQVYLAYWLGGFIGVSAVAAALVSIAIYAEVSLRHGIHQDDGSLPAPLNNWPVFGGMLVLFAFLGWQAHQPISIALIIEALIGFFSGMLIAWAGRLINVSSLVRLPSVWQTGLRVGLFMFASLLLWPRGTLVDPLPLAVALGVAVLTNVLSATVLSATLSLREESP